PSLYPLAWLVGSWQGAGALHHPTPEGPADRRVEQQLDCVANAGGTLAWTSLVHVIDDAAPLPPPSAFTSDDVPAPTPAGAPGRRRCARAADAGLRRAAGRRPPARSRPGRRPGGTCGPPRRLPPLRPAGPLRPGAARRARRLGR